MDRRDYEIISLLFPVDKLGSNMSCNNRYTNYARHIVVNKTVKSQLKLSTQKLDFPKSYVASPCLNKEKSPDIKNFI